MIVVNHNIEKLLEALPKLVVATVHALEEVVRTSLRTKDLLKKRWTKVQLENLKLDLRGASFEPRGIRRAIAEFCNEPTFENWRTVQACANKSSTVVMKLRKASGKRRVAREYTEVFQQIEATLDDKDSKYYLGDALVMPQGEAEISKLRALEPVYERVNEALLEIQSKLSACITELEQQLDGGTSPAQSSKSEISPSRPSRASKAKKPRKASKKILK